MTDKIELVDRVLSGEEVERPPLTLWYHFGVQHGPGDRFAKIALDFFNYYDFDFMKVMNDYFYPLPEGLDSVKSRDDLKRIVPIKMKESDWMEQLKALSYLDDQLRGKAYFVDTVFDPWHTLKRSLSGESVEQLMNYEKEATLEALRIVTDDLIEYCKKSLEAGSAGIFLSVVCGKELIGREHFLTFVKPFAMNVLESIAGTGIMNIVHIHGEELYFDDCLDFPAHIFNWWDRGPTGPSLAEVKEKIDGCVMGGIDHNLVNRGTPAFLKEHVLEGKRLGGKSRFFLSGGCSISTSVAPRAIASIVSAGKSEMK